MIAQRAGVRRFRPRLAIAATTFIVALALPAVVVGGSTRLIDPAVSPRTGTTATTFSFAVTYQNREGSGGPNQLVVLIDGVSHTMRGTGSDWKNGVRYSYSTRLAVGTHTIVFHSLGRDRFASDVDGGTVRVTAAPAPKPTPKPTSSGGSIPGSGSSGGSGSGGSSGADGSGAAGSVTGGSGGASGGDGSSGASGDGTGGSGGTTAPTGSSGYPGESGTPAHGDFSAGGNALGANAPAANAAGGTTSSRNDRTGSPAAGAGWGDLTVYLKALSWGGSATRSMPLLPSIVFSAGAVTLMMAFLFFGKRRRDGDPPEPDEVLSAAAARGTGQAATSSLVPNRQVPADIPPDEVGMPRWRRPSLLEARKMDPTRAAATAHAPMTFGAGGAATPGYERRLIRYHVVRLLDAPDELRAEEIGILARDDEVQLIERTGTYCRVLCPDGKEGWIHKMTLGDRVGEPSQSLRQALVGDELDDDVLTAFMTARGRA